MYQAAEGYIQAAMHHPKGTVMQKQKMGPSLWRIFLAHFNAPRETLPDHDRCLYVVCSYVLASRPFQCFVIFLPVFQRRLYLTYFPCDLVEDLPALCL